MDRICIVAEIGCNHNGSKELALRMADEARRCGADAVKLQAFHARDLVSRFAPRAEYQREGAGSAGNAPGADSQLGMLEGLELAGEDLREVMEHARSLGLAAFATPFDIGSIEFLDSIGQRIWKIPSGEVTDLPYLRKIGGVHRKGDPILLSTGMATMGEIRACVQSLVESGVPMGDLLLLHCNTEYPTLDGDVNLLAIEDLRRSFPGARVGLSDHSIGCVAAVGAAFLGVSLIEKHFTLDKGFPGPDHKASASPEELRELVENVRRAEAMAGSPRKVVTDSERKNRLAARKSIVALRDIEAGECLTEENITCKRPGNGISPMRWPEVLGKRAQRGFGADELIELPGFPWQEPDGCIGDREGSAGAEARP